MKKALFVLLAIGFLVSCEKKESEKSLEITGNIKGLQDGKLYLQRFVDTALVIIDSLDVDGQSTFEFSVDLEEPEMLYLFLDRGVSNSIDNNLQFFAEPGKMTIDTELKYFFAKAKFTGSENQTLFQDFQKVNTRFATQGLDITKEKFDAIRFNRLKDVDSIDKKLNNNLKRKYLYAINFALNNKDKEIAPYIALTELTNANIKFLDTIHQSLTPKVAKSKYGKLLTEYISEIKKTE